MDTERNASRGRTNRRGEPATTHLPHAYPFLMLDRMLMRQAGRWAVATKALTLGDSGLDREGVLPAVLVAEAMAQTAGMAAADGSVRVVVAQIDRFRCPRLLRAGDELVVTAHVVRRFGNTAKVHASVRSAGRFCAAAALVLHLSSPQ
jgi:3-hydroxyacyl-[acyl-carrier-protein] dehydratase